MAGYGPVPKRSSERIRRNKPDIPIGTITAIGSVLIPPLAVNDPHPIVSEIYESMQTSAQAQYYEPSDWAYANFTLVFCNQLLKATRPSGQLLATVQSMLAELLLTEGSRRRVRVEVERNQVAGEVIDVAELFRARLTS